MSNARGIRIAIIRALVGGVVGAVLSSLTLEIIALPLILLGLYGPQMAADAWSIGAVFGFASGMVIWARRVSARRAAVGTGFTYAAILAAITTTVAYVSLQSATRQNVHSSQLLLHLAQGILQGTVTLGVVGGMSGYLTGLIYSRFAGHFKTQEPASPTPRRRYSSAPPRLKI